MEGGETGKAGAGVGAGGGSGELSMRGDAKGLEKGLPEKGLPGKGFGDELEKGLE